MIRPKTSRTVGMASEKTKKLSHWARSLIEHHIPSKGIQDDFLLLSDRWPYLIWCRFFALFIGSKVDLKKGTVWTNNQLSPGRFFFFVKQRPSLSLISFHLLIYIYLSMHFDLIFFCDISMKQVAFLLLFLLFV